MYFCPSAMYFCSYIFVGTKIAFWNGKSFLGGKKTPVLLFLFSWQKRENLKGRKGFLTEQPYKQPKLVPSHFTPGLGNGGMF